MENSTTSTYEKSQMSKSDASVAVVIPTYNRINKIERTLNSVFEQSHTPYEIFVVDDGSTDNTAEFIKNSFPKVNLIQLPSNKGPAAARNTAIMKSQSDYIAFLDSDDTWSSDYLEVQLDVLTNNPEIKMVYSDYTKITNHWQKQFIDTAPSVHPNDIIKQLLLIDNSISTMSVVVAKKEAIIRAGLFDVNLRLTEDRDLYLRLAFQGDLVHNAKDIVTRYVDEDNLTNNVKLWAESLKYTQKKFFAHPRNKTYRKLLPQIKRYWATHSREIATQNGETFKSITYLIQDAFYSMLSFKTMYELTERVIHKVYKTSYKIAPKQFQKLLAKLTIPRRARAINELRTPTSLTLYVTTKCNLACEHCFYLDELNNPNVKDISLGQVRRIAASLKHNTTITLSGGEPFLRKDLDKICESFLHSGHVNNFTIASNGTAQSVMYDRCKEILELPKIQQLYIQISLDGLEETHDKIRSKKGTFKKVMQCVIELKKLRQEYPHFSFDFHTVIMRHNIDQIEELIRTVQKIGDIEHKFSFYRGSHTVFHLDHTIYSGFNADSEKYDNKETDQILFYEEMQSIYDRICELNKEYKSNFLVEPQRLKLKAMLDTVKAKKRITPCYAGAINGAIFSNGDVTLCEETTPIGNLADTSYNLDKLWNSKGANLRRKKIESCACIDACNMCTSVYTQQAIQQVGR